MLTLKRINYEDKEKQYLFVKDIPYDENGFINEYSGISKEEFVSKAIPTLIAHEKGECLPEGYVPETYYFLWDDDTIVAQFRLRHYLCESLVNGAGHIGYYVGKEFRGRGYATKGLALLLQEAKSIVPEDEYYLRVNKDNMASLSVMLRNGGYIHHEDDSKIYVRIKK